MAGVASTTATGGHVAGDAADTSGAKVHLEGDATCG
jgi:hypothetical protein